MCVIMKCATAAIREACATLGGINFPQALGTQKRKHRALGITEELALCLRYISVPCICRVEPSEWPKPVMSTIHRISAGVEADMDKVSCGHDC